MLQKYVASQCFYVSADISDHLPDKCRGGVQGDCSRFLGKGVMGVLEQPLQCGSDDAWGFPPLLHHHCHDTGIEISQSVSPYVFDNIPCDCDDVVVFAGKLDYSQEAV